MKKVLMWLAVSALGIFSIPLLFIFPGYTFSGLLLCGSALAVLFFYFLSVLIKRYGKPVRILRTVLTVLLCAAIMAGIVTLIPIVSESRGDKDISCEYLIVLGAGVNGTEPSLILQERLDRTYTYLTENPDTICVVSGGRGSGEDITEAQCMYRVLTQMGIDPQRILLEEAAATTWENLSFSLDLIESTTGKRPQTAGIVSNEFHLFRAKLMAKQQGISPVGIPANTTYTSLKINYFLREVAAVWKHLVLGGSIYG